MRLEQLVLFGPIDNFTVQFGPRVTVLAGLEPSERAAMANTLVDAMAGRLPNTSVIFTDATGRRIFADRMGATYADTGVGAPSLSAMVGTDPNVISDLVKVSSSDLGLAGQRTDDAVNLDITAAQAALEQASAAHADATAIVVEIDSWEQDLAHLDKLIENAPEDAARWEWIALRNHLDGLRAELASLDRGDGTLQHADTRLLEAVEGLREAGEVWLDAGAEAEALAARLGPLPKVGDDELERLALTPAAAPVDTKDYLNQLALAVEHHLACRDACDAASEPPEDPGDGIVLNLAGKPQRQLWKAYDAAVEARERYDAARADHDQPTETEAEVNIEIAHREVVRCQRSVQQRLRPGVLGSALLAVVALLAGDAISVVVGAIVLMASIGLGLWLLATPRKALAAAQTAEREALTHAEAESWLGLHLRRIDGFIPTDDHFEVQAALDLRSTTALDWETLSDSTSLGAAGDRREAILAYAAKTEPTAVAEAEREASAALASANAKVESATDDLLTPLRRYGVASDTVADIDLATLEAVVAHRVSAGQTARDVIRLRELSTAAQAAGNRLETLLRKLGFDDGNMAGRLDRAVVAVEAARQRRLARESTSSRDELEVEIARLAHDVERGRRLAWDLTSDFTDPPTDPASLMDERRGLAERIAQRRRPDAADMARRVALANDRVEQLRQELSTMSEGPVSVRRRLADRIARTSWLGTNEEALPLVIDEALIDMDPGELFKLLDMVVRLSDRVQVIYLSGDPAVARWARREADAGTVSLLESEGAAIY